jgi:uncharacterized protein YabE (DUF348 family)
VRKIIPVVIAGATILAVAGGTLGYASSDKAVTLSLDGQVQELNTTAGTVGALLDREGIEVSSRDLVAPGVDTELDEGTQVAVRFGREVTFTVDGEQQTIWTTATTVDQAVGALGIDIGGAELSTSRSSSIGRQGLSVDIATEKSIIIDDAGDRRRLKTTAQTVGEALAVAKITVDADDKLSPAKTAQLEDDTLVRYTRVDVKAKTKKQKVAFDTVRKESKTLTRGTTKVDTAGSTGVRKVSYRIVRHNGEIVSVKRTGTKVSRQPVDQVILVGTKAPKVSKSDSSGGSSGGSNTSGGVWDKIAQCESGGNWSINTGNGYYGGLQFALSTWRAYGGNGMPQNNSKSAQIAVAKKVQAAQGWGAWPACTAKLGLR